MDEEVHLCSFSHRGSETLAHIQLQHDPFIASINWVAESGMDRVSPSDAWQQARVCDTLQVTKGGLTIEDLNTLASSRTLHLGVSNSLLQLLARHSDSSYYIPSIQATIMLDRHPTRHNLAVRIRQGKYLMNKKKIIVVQRPNPNHWRASCVDLSTGVITIHDSECSKSAQTYGVLVCLLGYYFQA